VGLIVLRRAAGGSSIRDCGVLCQSMPKLKTRKAAAKDSGATGSGKIARRKAFKNHLPEHKTPDKKRSLPPKWQPG